MNSRIPLRIGTAMALAAAPWPAAAQAISASEATELRAQIAALKAQVQQLESRLDGMAAPAAQGQATPAPAPTGQPPAQMTQAAPALPVPDTVTGWKGGPVFSKGAASFKVKGRIQYDAGLLKAPGSVDDGAKGYSNELRRLRLGGEGQLGGGFGYKLEVELSDNKVDAVDTYISYERGKWLVMLGNQNQFQSLDELIGDTSGSVMERAAFTDAFGFERRLGLAVQYKSGIVLAQAGIFSDSIDSLVNPDGDQNNSYGVDGRVVLAPKFGKTQLHFGLSGHWRDLQRLSGNPVEYRQRPFLHTVNSYFLNSGKMAVHGENHYGLELAGVHGPLWWAGEGHWLRVRRPGLADPTFFGGYGEVGYVLTGETRSYKNGIFGGVKPDNPVGNGSGGLGAWQVALRYDHLDMNDRDIVGGTQKSYIAALVWTPIEYLRFNVNYAHIDYIDAAIRAGSRSNYGVNVLGWRAELDF
ncbi:phosphate-selective porin OprO and OprP [Sphingobium faniae]|nr:phosphate-selective porin OprO and OprP [Sphingobium faniae]